MKTGCGKRVNTHGTVCGWLKLKVLENKRIESWIVF